jgi:hypothetical protein
MLCWAFAAFADVAVPPLVGRVVDQTGTLSSDEMASLNQTLRNFEARKGSQVAVLIVPTTAPETIEQYSLRLAEAWKIGRKKIDDGAVLVVAKDDRKLRIEVGYGLEGALTDVTSKRIIDEIITPRFRSRRRPDHPGGRRREFARACAAPAAKLRLPEPCRSAQSLYLVRGLCRRRYSASHIRQADRLGRDRWHCRSAGMDHRRIACGVDHRGDDCFRRHLVRGDAHILFFRSRGWEGLVRRLWWRFVFRRFVGRQ